MEYEIINNMVSMYRFTARIVLRNGGDETIPSGTGWHIFFNQMRTIESVAMEKEGHILVANLQMMLTYLNRDLYQLSPTKQFPGLSPGYALVFMFEGAGATLSPYELLPNWYVTRDNSRGYVIESTRDVTKFTLPFTKEEQFKASKVDQHKALTPQDRYDLYEIEDRKRAAHMVMPIRVHIATVDEATLTMKHDWVVVGKGQTVETAKYLASKCTNIVSFKGKDLSYTKVLMYQSVSPSCDNKVGSLQILI